MSKPAADIAGVYRFTSIARPIDPGYPSNRTLLIVLPLLALVSAGLAALGILRGSPLSAAFGALLTSFAAWALTRELAPDDDAAAFAALALAWIGNLVVGTESVVLPFSALFLVRLINRSTGLAARPLDTLGVLGFCIWAAISLEQALIVMLAAAAFALDATLRQPLRRHFIAAGVCVAVFLWLLIDGASLISGNLTIRDWSLMILFAGAAALVVSRSAAPVSACDVSSERLDAVRVNASLVMGLLLATQALLTDGRSAWLASPIWACVASALVFSLVRHALRRTS